MGQERIRSLLRWAGGKTRLLTRLLKYVPEDSNSATYWEPFLGGASMFLALAPKRAHLSDANPNLIDFYRQVKLCPDLIHRYLNQLSSQSSREFFYTIRSKYNEGRPSVKQAARFLYLNKYSYGGVFRVNTSGQYNVPYGERERYVLPSKVHMRQVAEVLQSATLSACSYEEMLPNVRRNSFVYLDPPYPPLNGTSNFTHYTPDRFSETDQQRLAKMVKKLDRVGASFMMTNADVPLVRELYGEYHLHPLSVSRSVTCKHTRHNVSVLVVTNYIPPACISSKGQILEEDA